MTGVALPLLRAPPFPGIDAAVTRPGDCPAPDVTPDRIERLFSAIREARVGGDFWGRQRLPARSCAIYRPRSDAESGVALALVPEGDRPTAQAMATIDEQASPVDFWSMQPNMTALVAHGDDEWVALAVIAGVPVRLMTAGRYGTPGDDAATLRERVARQLFQKLYRDPFTGQPADLFATIAVLGDWRRMFADNRNIVAGCGFSWWKRQEIGRFLYTPEHPLRFFRSERRALDHAARLGGAVAIWPSRVSSAMIEAAAVRAIPLVRVEDGFVRSVGLGSNLVPPSSVAVDWRGIHYDPGKPSDLETLLANADFAPALLARAARLRETILQAGISKYGSDMPHAFPPRQAGRRLVLVPGQVEDDMSVRLGGGGLASNLDLLRRARQLEPAAEIWFRPHPDVTAGHRRGAVSESDALRYADRVVEGGGMAPLLDLVDGVHVLTSLTGFEALLRGRDVTCHGTPFYAGWGVTRDLGIVPERRGRARTVLDLIAGVLIQYPRYLDPVTGLPCTPEVLIARMGQGAARNRLGWITRLRRLQGRITGARKS
ncbi:beta-3-deoxy-D-manno-oct-2-ulosonic acid transferase [Sphingomonas sp. CARO-RG-8B-R24-01]|uniref:capsular polysaccharide export protein, LipB/KpsS family n=1 Tax=Sphingomonas sp. CARO-RG-8B-R24-01 TaxID=2914831 RepID=UPI001F55C747|nr:beta-3-deoxy-D-manno-oct-2-ulosonic acid transferase [Sphingomonas sp. CARO-RG-8B-R24-01]